MSKNTDKPMGHGAEADGIEEYDNPLPDWYIGLFFITIAWGVIYMVNWHVIDHKSAAGLYAQEMAAAKLQYPDLDKKVVQDTSAETLALGQEVFTTTCVACHNADMTGKIGPNLIDTKWIHGGEFENVVNTITNGVPAKGMPTWGPILGPKKVAAVASFVLSKNTGQPSNDPYGGGAAAAPAAPADPAAAPADPAAAPAAPAATPATAAP